MTEESSATVETPPAAKVDLPKEDTIPSQTKLKVREKSEDEIALPKVSRGDCKLATHAFRVHSAVIPSSLKNPKENLGRSDVWSHVSAQLQMGDEIRAVDEEGRYMARLYVTFKHGRKVMAKVLEFHDLSSEVMSLDSFADERYEIALKGPHKWCVIDLETGEKIRKMIPTKEAALQELANFLKRFKD